MPELRKDPVTERWAIISTERGKRPTDFRNPPKRQSPGVCPFCPGNESATPSELLARRDDGSAPNGPGWRIRAFPNKFPALRVEGELKREAVGIYDKMNGIGAHEVIVETPDHERDFHELPIETIADVLAVFRERALDLERDQRFRYIMLFKNHGENAGASLEHSHSQLVATPIVPKRVDEELQGAHRYYGFKERCIYCDIIRQDLSDGARVVVESEAFAALAPFAPRFPFETWILPKSHFSGFPSTPAEYDLPLAEILRETLMRMNLALNFPAYNFVLHTTPLGGKFEQEYHWHVEIIPKLTRVAGFEWGTGFYINPTPPEEAAAYMRSLDVTSHVAAVS